jgi:hypothetical protein
VAVRIKLEQLINSWFDFWGSFSQQQPMMLSLVKSGPQIDHRYQQHLDFVEVNGDGFPTEVDPLGWPYSYSYDGWVTFEMPVLQFQPAAPTTVRSWIIYQKFSDPVIMGDDIFPEQTTIAGGEIVDIHIAVNISDHGPPCP